MAVIRFNPFPTFERAARKMNDFFGDIERNVNLEVGGFTPRVDIIDEDETIIVKADLPGIRKEDVNISVNEDRILTIKGVKRRDDRFGEMSYIRSERIYSEFNRSFALPDSSDIEKISAKFENGVLILTIPKTEPPAPKEINIDIL